MNQNTLAINHCLSSWDAWIGNSPGCYASQLIFQKSTYYMMQRLKCTRNIYSQNICSQEAHERLREWPPQWQKQKEILHCLFRTIRTNWHIYLTFRALLLLPLCALPLLVCFNGRGLRFQSPWISAVIMKLHAHSYRTDCLWYVEYCYSQTWHNNCKGDTECYNC